MIELAKAEKRVDNCPNCGAPIESDVCPYCGTHIIDFATMDLDKPFFLRIKANGKAIRARALVENLVVETQPWPAFYSNNVVVQRGGPTVTMSMDFLLLSTEDEP